MPYVKAEKTLTEDELKAMSDAELAELVAPYISQERSKKILHQAILDGKLPDMRDPVIVGTVTWGRVMIPGYEEAVKDATKRVGTGGGGQKAAVVSVAGVTAGVPGEVEIEVPDTDKELLAKEKTAKATDAIASGTKKPEKPVEKPVEKPTKKKADVA